MSAKRELRKREILESGLAVLYRNGYAATGVQEIADASGIPKGSFYNYFDSKEAFALEAVQHYAQRLLAVEAVALGVPGSSAQDPKVASESDARGLAAFQPPPSSSPVERVLLFFQRLAEYHQARGEPGQGCLVGNLSQEIGAHSALIAGAVNEFFQEFRRPIYECLRLAGAEAPGRRAAYGDPDLLAALVVDGYQGALVRMKARRSAEPLFEFHRALGAVLGR